MQLRRTLELTIGRDDFLRLLKEEVGDLDVNGDVIECLGAHVQAAIRLTPLATADSGGRPRHLIKIVLDASCDAEAEVFMERFDRAFLRGG